MKNAVFWDMPPCRYCVNRRFGGTYLLHLQGIRNPRTRNQSEQVAADLPISLRHALSSLFRKAGSWVRIPEKAWMFGMYICLFCACVLSFV
jgi:hypothetical protein